MKEKQHMSGFKVPEGYFESFKDRLQDKLEEPLTGLSMDDGFGVPKGYFESFNQRLFKKIGDINSRVVPLHPYRKYFLVAASVAAIVALIVLLPKEQGTHATFDSLADNEITHYMEFSELELTDDEIAQLLPVEDLEISDMLQSQLNEDNIIDYLDNTMDDYDELNIDIDE